MATVTVSGRVDAATKRLADMYIRRHGTTPAEVISSVWRYIADTGEMPVGAQSKPTDSGLLQAFEALRAQTPMGTPLSTMSVSDLKKELSDRG